ncbi:hypothetical protein Tco_0977055 [Tanacetum coccineum]|uniref:Uncharacterized protein n=1 Tax=Tanacetum coccineum TaxID=301880 RepID=A0ABQ5EJ09_9ASTR
MASTRASIYKASKRPKINIIPPKQLFVDLTQEDTKTPSPKQQLSSPSAPNAPSKTPSTKGTSSSSIDYIPKSPTSSISPSINGYLNSLTSPPPRFPPPPPTQENASMDITLTPSPSIPLDVQFATPSPFPPIFGHTIPWNLFEAHGDSFKEQVKEQVSKSLPKIKKFVNDQLEAEVLTRSSNQAKTSYAVAANLSELELKKIFIDKMENNKSIDRSIQQKTLYNALVDAYETDKDILETYGDTVRFKRRQDDEDKDEEPSARSNWGSKRRRAGKEPESTSAPKEKTSMSTDKSKEGSKSHHTSSGKSAQEKEPIHADEDMEKPAHQKFDTGFTEDQPVDATTQHPNCVLAQNEDPRESFNELMDTPLDFSTFVINRLKVDTLTPELLACPTYELMKGSVILRRRVEDLQLGVESFIYQNKDKKNRLVRIDELYKFSDGTLNDVWSALDDILKRIQMEYLPQIVWRNVDRERAGAMNQAIDRQLRNIRLLRSLENFIGGGLYGGDLRLLVRTI